MAVKLVAGLDLNQRPSGWAFRATLNAAMPNLLMNEQEIFQGQNAGDSRRNEF
jgi:hypothetical protein